MVRISLLEFLGDSALLADPIAGYQVRKRLDALPPPGPTCPIFLDFAGVKISTATALRAVVIKVRDHLLASQIGFLVVANPAQQTIDELESLLTLMRDAVWICQLVGDPACIMHERVLGYLDEVHSRTLGLVNFLGSGDAPTLAAAHQQPPAPGSPLDAAMRAFGSATSKATPVGITAWNNRLSYLARKGLLIERRVGKLKIFSPSLSGPICGGARSNYSAD